jgi:quercetin dioxygenase-like cupin family protein
VGIVDFGEVAKGRSATFVGKEHGSSVSFFVTNHRPGGGPGPHRHPYDETFVVLEGRVVFTVDGEDVEAHAGQAVVVPAGATHSFSAAEPEGSLQVNIHPVAEMVTEWL